MPVAPAPAPSPVPPAAGTPVPVEQVSQEAQAAAPAQDPTQAVVNDPLVKRIVELFNARIVHAEPWKKP